MPLHRAALIQSVMGVSFWLQWRCFRRRILKNKRLNINSLRDILRVKYANFVDTAPIFTRQRDRVRKTLFQILEAEPVLQAAHIHPHASHMSQHYFSV
jgi:hypothetical protein